MNRASKTGSPFARTHAVRREEEKELHQLRLQLKAVRVHSQLLEFAFPERYPAKSLFAPYREYYRQTSRLRDLTICRQRFRKLCRQHRLRHNGFSSWLWYRYREEAKILEKQWLPELNEFEEQHRGELPDEELNTAGSRLAASVMETVLERLRQPIISEQLHYLRKQIKKLIYLNQLSAGTPSLLKSPLPEKLGAIDEKLGQWHDWQVLFQLVGQFSGIHARGHTPAWLPTVNRMIRAEQIRILMSLNDI